MSIQNLIIYKFNTLYHILEELSLDLNFKIAFVDSENSLKEKIKNLNNHLIISNKKYSDIGNQFILVNAPIDIQKLIEKGLIKLTNFSRNSNKVNYIYILTPKGIEQKTKLTFKFLAIKLEEYEILKNEINKLKKGRKSK